jgi:hydrogenase maturation factor
MERRHLTAQTDIKTIKRQLDLDYVREVTLGRGRLILV